MKEFHINFHVEALLQRPALLYEERLNVDARDPEWTKVRRQSQRTQNALNESHIHWFVNDEKMLINPDAHIIKSQNYEKINPLHDAIAASKARKLLQKSPLQEPLSGLVNMKQMYGNNDYKSMSKFIHKKIAAEMKKAILNTNEVAKLQKSVLMLERKYNKAERMKKDNFINGLSVENPCVELLGFHVPVSIFLQHILRCLPFDEIIRSSLVEKNWQTILRDRNNTKAIKPRIVDFNKMRSKSVKIFEKVIKNYQPQQLILPQSVSIERKFINRYRLLKDLSSLQGIHFNIIRHDYQMLLELLPRPEKITMLGKLTVEVFSDERLNELELIIEKFPNVTSLHVKFCYNGNPYHHVDTQLLNSQAVNERLCKILKLMTNKWSNLTNLDVTFNFQIRQFHQWGRFIPRILEPGRRIGPSGNFFETFVTQFKKLTLLKLDNYEAESYMIKSRMEPSSFRILFPSLEEVHLIGEKFPVESVVRFLIDTTILKTIHVEMTSNPIEYNKSHLESLRARMQLALFCFHGGTWTTNIQKFKQLDDLLELRKFKDEFDTLKQESKSLRKQIQVENDPNYGHEENSITLSNTRSAPTSKFNSGNNRFNNVDSGSSCTNINNMMMMPMHNTNFSS